MDSIDVLQNEIRRSFKERSHLTCVFFDIEKAYDRVWRSHVVKQLQDWGLEGNIIHFIWNFLQDRKFQVSIGNHLSRTFVLDNGVPQGSVLAVTLFLVAINSIQEEIHSPVQNIKIPLCIELSYKILYKG